MRMRKSKKKELLLKDELDDRFVIYQIEKPLIYTGKREFKPSKATSPFYGSNVVDRESFPDNAGALDIDYGYDYVRKDEDKHISKEELIRRHGTEYYEFDINSPYQEPEREPEAIEKKPEVASSFISTIDDLTDEPMEEEINELKINIMDNDLDMKPELQMDDDVSEDMPDVATASIPAFLEDKPEIKFNDVDLDEDLGSTDLDAREPMDEDLSFNEEDLDNNEEEEANNDEYYNPAVDRNISIAEAIKRQQEEYPDFNPSRGPINRSKEEDLGYVAKPTREPIANERASIPRPQAKPEPKRKPPMEYKIPYQKFLPVSEENNGEIPAWLEEKKEIINKTLSEFGIDGEVINYTKGPAFTLYEILLAPGVNVKKLNQINDNLQMELKVKSIRMLLPIPGKNTVGIEAPNDEAEMVRFGDIINDDFINDGHPLRIALGKHIDGTAVYQDIEDMPHALIAGATKSGKSVCMNTILVSLLLKNSPEDLKLILVDPKKVELSFYSDIPHLATPVITDPAEATEALKWATIEMDRRFDTLSRYRCKQLKDYNKKRKQDPEMAPMPYIICVVDEFNDLVMTSGSEVTDHIVRLAQKGRACGIHVILATQRPTVDVVSGTIKANIACRIAFKVSSSLDSSIILDETGAESLLGRGDMLFKNNDVPFRAQGAFIQDEEIDSVCEYIAENYSDDYMGGQGVGGKSAEGEDSELLYAIAEFCIESNSCSINSIQNHFSLGFNRAQRIVQLLEEMNIVSPKCGTKKREILVDSYKLNEIFGYDD